MNKIKLAFLALSAAHTLFAGLCLMYSDNIFSMILNEEAKQKMVTSDLFVQQLVKALTIFIGFGFFIFEIFSLYNLFVGGLLCQTENKGMVKTAAFIEILQSAFIGYLSRSEYVERKYFWIDSAICLFLGLMMAYVGFYDNIQKVQKVFKKAETKGQTSHEIKIE
jgi:hypothetical protein